MNKKILALVAILIVAGIAALVYTNLQPGKLDSFTTCLKDKGVTFYGAFWCPHCQNQKKIFGKSAGLLPYVECSTPDGKGQYQVCKDKGVESYPTWDFADGSRQTGELTLSQLSEKTSCSLPQGVQ